MVSHAFATQGPLLLTEIIGMGDKLHVQRQ